MKYTPEPWKVGFYMGKFDGWVLTSNQRPLAYMSRDENAPTMRTIDEIEANAHLIASAPDLYKEHIQWGKILGHVLVMALQGDYSDLNAFAKQIKLDYRDGEPFIQSPAIFKAEGRG
jgi:hypothetical protein